MHLEILIEDSSGAKLVGILMPKIIGAYGSPHTWRLHSYKGIGKLPPGLAPHLDPAKRQLLDQLPKLLSGFGKTEGIDAVVVILDSDRRNCKEFLGELKEVLDRCHPAPRTLFRLAIEEIEAWYFGDRRALLSIYPFAKTRIIDSYIQDSVCGTWETLADAVMSGGAAALKKPGAPLPGNIKHEWTGKIGPQMRVETNTSPSFCKFRDGLRRLVGMS